MVFITDFNEGDQISEVYLCKSKQIGTTKAGKTYYNLDLVDKTGNIAGKVWELNNAIGHFEAKNFIKVDGQVTSFNSELQLNIKRIRLAEEGEYVETDYMPCSEKNIDEMYNELLALVDTIKKPYYKELLKKFFVEDKDMAAKFKYHSAAKSIHHGFMGGLLEHSLAVAKMCDYYASYYKELNRDLLVTAALLHDIGKIFELSKFPENDYTDEGQLLGHIVMGAMMVRDKIKEIGYDKFPAKEANELEHCILAHHGELEYGSPKKPALIEAVALSFADNTDAKLQTFKEELKKAKDGGWLGFNRALQSNIRKTTE
jgi:3'-5' exoribonuclease